MKTLTGTDVIVAIVLEKVELCARRALTAKYPNGTPPSSLIDQFSTEIMLMLKAMRDD